MTITYKKANHLRKLIAGLLTSSSIVYEDRIKLRDSKKIIDDLLSDFDWKMTCYQESYSEMKAHKSVIESVDKLENILTQFQSKKETLMKEVVEFSPNLFPLSRNFKSDAEKEIDYLHIYDELDGLIFNLPQ